MVTYCPHRKKNALGELRVILIALYEKCMGRTIFQHCIDNFICIHTWADTIFSLQTEVAPSTVYSLIIWGGGKSSNSKVSTPCDKEAEVQPHPTFAQGRILVGPATPQPAVAENGWMNSSL